MGPKEELPRRVVMPCLVRVASVVAGEPVLVLLTRIPVAAAGLLVVQGICNQTDGKLTGAQLDGGSISEANV